MVEHASRIRAPEETRPKRHDHGTSGKRAARPTPADRRGQIERARQAELPAHADRDTPHARRSHPVHPAASNTCATPSLSVVMHPETQRRAGPSRRTRAARGSARQRPRVSMNRRQRADRWRATGATDVISGTWRARAPHAVPIQSAIHRSAALGQPGSSSSICGTVVARQRTRADLRRQPFKNNGEKKWQGRR